MMKKRKKTAAKMKPPTIEVPVHYVRSPHFRTMHADGVLGGIMPSGRAMNIVFYSERIPFPQEETYDVGLEGKMSKPRVRKGPKGIFREIEIAVVLDYEAAKALMLWLHQVVPMLGRCRGKED